MKSEYQIEVDELAISLTKPAMKLGVPFFPFYLNMMTCFFGWMMYQAITGSTNIMSTVMFIVIWLVIHIMMFIITSQDGFGLTIFWVNTTHFKQHRNHTFWGNTDSYKP
jgi:type IV secretory pathway VirB3-like protein